jgi:hypothetical protein
VNTKPGLTARGQLVQEAPRHAFPGGLAAEDLKPPSVANFHGDKLAALVEFLAEQGVLVVQGGDRGGGRVKLVVELRAFASLVCEFSSQDRDFVVLAVNPRTRRPGCFIRPVSGRLGSWWRGLSRLLSRGCP